MKKKRVAITGFSAITPLGDTWQDFRTGLTEGRSAIRYMDEWAYIQDLHSRLAAPVTQFELPKHYTRKKTRTMGKVSKFAVRSTELALEQAGLLANPVLSDGRTGVSFGSCTGSTDAMKDFSKLVSQGDISGINATTYVRLMSYTTAANIAVFFGLKGRLISTCTACTSGSQGIGYAFESIQSGKQTVMVAGGAEALCPSETAIFDTLYATSVKNNEPTTTPRPFDEKRDGLVVGEGGCSFILEDWDFARARGANIIAEVLGFGTNCDGNHITQPTKETMAGVMQLALEDAGLGPGKIGYINAHGTATRLGDVAESHATHQVFGAHMPISSLKGNIGHTLGACGAIEAWAAINMMNDCWFAPTHNLQKIDSQCAQLNYLIGKGCEIDTDYVMTNNFAFGGVNTALIFKRVKP